MNPSTRLAQLSFTAGPAALLAGWLLMHPVQGGLEPGPWWTAAHVVWLAAFLMFGVMTLAVRGLAGPVTGERRVAVEALTGVALFGVAANVVRLGIDLYAGLAALDGAAMRAMLEQVRSYPGVELIVYTAGAYVFYLALVALAVLLAVLRRVTPVSAGLTVSGVVLLGVASLQEGENSALVGVGMAVIWLGTLLLGRGSSGGPGLGATTPPGPEHRHASRA